MEPEYNIMPCSLTNILKGGSASRTPTKVNKKPECIKKIVFNYYRKLQNLQLKILERVSDDSNFEEIGNALEELEEQVEKLIVSAERSTEKGRS